MVEYCLRLLVATLCGALIGAERSFQRKDAGVRTHAIFSLAACLFMLLSKYAFFGAQGGADPTMIACQVVMGVNFFCGGIIFRSGQVVSHGLTTAAGVWATAAIGMACGCGMKLLALDFTLLIIGLHLLIHRYNIGGTAYTPQKIKITVENTERIWPVLRELRKQYGIRTLSARYKRTGNLVTLNLQVHIHHSIPLGEVLRLMDTYKEIKEFSV